MMTDAEKEEARRIIAVQASTAPEDGDLSPEGSLRRASPLDACGHPVHVDKPSGFPSQSPFFKKKR